tara:strand:+ start:536 stop:946 length:411 start_codon:yes stop_codon:yes gene_type:complete
MGTGKRRRKLAYGHRELVRSKLENGLTIEKNNIIGIEPDELKAGDIVVRYQSMGARPHLVPDPNKPAAKWLIIGRVKMAPHRSDVYFHAYLLWCDENYLGVHHNVGDMWQIPWYAFANESSYKIEFKADKSRSPAK